MARENKLFSCGIAKEIIMTAWNLGGDDRQSICQRVGFASVNGMYNALRAAGWIDGGPVSNGNGGEKRTTTKIKGCLPFKVMVRIAKILDLDLEENEPGWDEWVQVANMDPDFEGFSMVRLVGGEDSEGGKSYRLWIDSNRANDRAIAEAAARAADPTFKLKEQLAKANSLLDEREREIDDLKSRIATMESELAAAKSRPAARGPRMGGELDQSMLRLMKQRFHPDRNNGDTETATRVMQWLNAIEL